MNGSSMASSSLSTSASALSPFTSLEERVAHLQWRKVCNERQIQGTLQLTKQMQERDEFVRVAKSVKKEKNEWMHHVIEDELSKPLSVTPQFVDNLTRHEQGLERNRQDATKRHLTQLKGIQSKLDEREAHQARKTSFERKKKELYNAS